MYGESGPHPSCVVDFLDHQQFPKVAEAVRAQTYLIVQQWDEAIRNAALLAGRHDRSLLHACLPQTLAALAADLALDHPAQRHARLKPLHDLAHVPPDQDVSMSDLILEYRVLRRLVVERVEEQLRRPLTTAEDLALDMAIDGLLQQSVVACVQRQNERLQQAAEAESKFLSFLSHDLRNSLNSVVLSLEVLRHDLAPLPQLAEALADVEATKHSILETIDGMERLLQAERLRKNPQPRLSPVDLRLLSADTARRLAHQAQRKGLTLAVEVPPDAIINSDREWITLVLQNLIGNAIKYSPRGTIQIIGAPRPDRQGWVLAVSDEGPGIAPQQLRTLFEAFQRGETHGQPGVGLGLAIAAQAAQVLGGQLTVDSHPGSGSTFRLSLPWSIPARMT